MKFQQDSKTENYEEKTFTYLPIPSKIKRSASLHFRASSVFTLLKDINKINVIIIILNYSHSRPFYQFVCFFRHALFTPFCSTYVVKHQSLYWISVRESDRARVGGYSLIWPIQVCAAPKGKVFQPFWVIRYRFQPFCRHFGLKQGIDFSTLVLNQPFFRSYFFITPSFSHPRFSFLYPV